MPNWHALPFARILLLFIAVKGLYAYIPVKVELLLCALVCFLLSLYLLKKIPVRMQIMGHWVKGLHIILILGSSFLILLHAKDEKQFENHYLHHKKSIVYQIKIDSEPKIKGKNAKAEALVELGFDKNGVKLPCRGKILLNLPRSAIDDVPQRGDVLLVPARLLKIPEPSASARFNYREYLEKRQIYRQYYLKTEAYLLFRSHRHDLKSLSETFRTTCLLQIKKYIPGEISRSILEALTLGFKDDITTETNRLFTASGTMHVLAVSGLHTGMIYLILLSLMNPLKKMKGGEFLLNCLLILGLWAYAFVTGLTASVIRAAVMLSLISLADLFHLRKSTFNNIFASAFMMLIYRPDYMTDLGFQLSYAAVLGIVFLNPKLKAMNRFQNKIARYIIDLSIVSFCAQVFTFPLCLLYFQQFPSYFLISNLIVIPVFTCVLILGFSLISLSWFPLLATGIAYLTDQIIQAVLYLLNHLVKWPYSTLQVAEYTGYETAMTYLILFALLAFLIYKRFVFFGAMLLTISCLFAGSARKTMKTDRQIDIRQIKINKKTLIICQNKEKAFLISDSITLSNVSPISVQINSKFELQTTELIPVNFKNVFVSTNFIYFPGYGFQFFDKKMTIKKTVHLNVQSELDSLVWD